MWCSPEDKWACILLDVTLGQSESNMEDNPNYRRQNNCTGALGNPKDIGDVFLSFPLLKIVHKLPPLILPLLPCLFTQKSRLTLRGLVSFPVWHLNVGVSLLSWSCTPHILGLNLLCQIFILLLPVRSLSFLISGKFWIFPMWTRYELVWVKTRRISLLNHLLF